MFACEEIPVTVGAGQSVAVSLALEGLAQPLGNLRAFFQVIRIHDDTLQGGFVCQQGAELSNPQQAIDTYCCAYDEVHLTVAEVDLRVGTLTMPDVYEDDLPSVVPMNRDYDQGRIDGQSQPLPDCDPNATQLFTDYGDDELVSGHVVLPWSSNATWKMIIPPELRVWRWDSSLQTWWLVESGVSYSASVSGQLFNIKVEGLSPSGVPPYLTVSCQKTDGEGSPLGTPVTDRVLVEVVSIDLEVAGISELDEETWAASLLVNDDYDEGNLHPYSVEDVSDNDRLHGQLVAIPPHIVAWDADLTAATLTIDGPNEQTGKYWIEVIGEPTWLQYPDWPGYNQYIRIWLPNGTAVPRSRETALPITLDAQAVDLLIEGLAKYDDEQHPIRLIAHFEPDGDYVKAGVEADVADEALALVGVNDWARDTWSGERGLYFGTATAGSYYDTFEQLAKNITGKSEDAFFLRATNPYIDRIEPGTVVDISKLLEVLEERLRNNVVDAANSAKAAEFGKSYQNLIFSEAGINRIFGVGRPSEALLVCDCQMMINIIMTRGVIMELMPGEYDAMDLHPDYFGNSRGMGFPVGEYFNFYDPPIARAELKNGDWAQFWNNPGYTGGMWAAENVIKVDGVSYYGWARKGGKTKSYLGWKEALRDAYEEQLGIPGYSVPLSQIPGYDDWPTMPKPISAGFIDVAKLAMAIFDFRKSL